MPSRLALVTVASGGRRFGVASHWDKSRSSPRSAGTSVRKSGIGAAAIVIAHSRRPLLRVWPGTPARVSAPVANVPNPYHLSRANLLTTRRWVEQWSVQLVPAVAAGLCHAAIRHTRRRAIPRVVAKRL